MTYEQLDAIADAFIPLLLIYCIAILIKLTVNKKWRELSVSGLTLIVGIVQTYGLMFLDNALGIWPKVELDYSTHTSLALVLTVFIAFESKRSCISVSFLMLLYVLLMRYQAYHTYADMLTTAFAVLPILIWTNLKRIQLRKG